MPRKALKTKEAPKCCFRQNLNEMQEGDVEFARRVLDSAEATQVGQELRLHALATSGTFQRQWHPSLPSELLPPLP